jgi:flagellar basal body-associated protein FliL
LGKNNVLLIVIVVLLVLLLAAVGGVSYYAFTVIQNQQQDQGSAPSNSADAAIKLTVDQISKVPLSSEITTNLMKSSDGTDHLVRINLSIGVNNTDKKQSDTLITSLTNNEMVTRDIVLGILRGETYEDLSVPEGQELLKDDIKTQLQDEYNTNLIVQVYISDLAFS